MLDLGCASVTVLIYCCYLAIFHTSGSSAEFANIYFTQSPEPIAAPIGDEISFQCTLNYKPNEFRWKHGSKLLAHNKPELKVVLNDTSQVGDYQCIAWYGSQTALASVSARLSLAELQPFPPQKDEFYTVTPGNTFTIYCSPPVSNPAPIIKYKKDDVELPANTPILPTTGSLLLPNITEKDSGIYSCSASNYLLASTVQSSMKVHVKVVDVSQKEQPKFLREPQSTYTVQAGSNITLECTAVGQPIPTITWDKTNSQLPSNRTEVVPGGLSLMNVIPEDAGEYICSVSNGFGSTVSRGINVQVQELPRVMKGPTLDVAHPQEGGKLTLTCDVRGTPEPSVSWLLNAEPLDLNPSVQVLGKNGNVLKIWTVEKHHAGVYQCFATNPVGSVYGATIVNIAPKEAGEESSTRLPLNSGSRGKKGGGHHRGRSKNKNRGKQHKETVMATKPNVTRLTDTAIMVRWSVRNNSGPGIDFFKVQHVMTANTSGGSHNNRRIWSTSDELVGHIRAFEVANLLPEQFYRFRIAAVFSNNEGGVGPATGWFKLNANDTSGKPPPSAPEIINAEPVSPTSIKVQWQYNNSLQNPIGGFYLYYCHTSTAAAAYMTVVVSGGDIREHIVTELQPETSYDFKARSFTPTAASPFSSIRSQRTKKSDQSKKVEEEGEKKKEPPREQPPPASQLYLYIGIAVGGFGLFIVVCFLCCCFRRHSSSESDEDGTESCSKIGDTALTIQQIEPVTMNGYSNHANHLNHNGKMLNGRTPQRNGFNYPGMTITNNPLAESEQSKNVMELSYLSSQNNNCSAEGSSN